MSEEIQSNVLAEADFNLDKPIEVVGSDVPPGQYPGRFLGFDPKAKKLKSKFGDAWKVNAMFAVKLPSGDVERVSQLVTPPSHGGLHRKSALYGMLRALAPQDPEIWTGDALNQGVTLSRFVNRTCTVTTDVRIDKNGNSWPKIKNVGPGMSGLAYPTDDEIKKLNERLAGVEADAGYDGDDIPF